MDPKIKAWFEARARIIRAIAHATRLFIVSELAKEEKCVCELTDLIGADMSTVSKHLALLKAAGIVRDEKRGTQVYYTLMAPCILDFLNCIGAVLKANATEQLKLAK